LIDASRQSGLRDAASFGSAGEMLFACERKEKFKLIDQDWAPCPKLSRRGATITPPCEKLSQLMENAVVSQYF
jgi:hypothetical protein